MICLAQLVGCEVIEPKTGATPLHAAAEGRSLGCLALLLKVNAPLDNPDAKGRTAVHCCVEVGWQEGLAVLLQAGANPNLRVRAVHGGENPILCICSSLHAHPHPHTQRLHFCFLWKPAWSVPQRER